MPCYDHRDSPSYINEHTIEPLQEKVDLYASWLCLILRNMPESIIAHFPLDLQMWWNEHKEFDSSRGQI